ncbi:hypothetical protein F3Y22_tig00111842pilonHSYRG00050 [Hibiscus syriacus]|uniref:BHLH domain-containing protein n=1 Tax=Hibiscus syriacus TaxID=106335 RepID=A0A6A2YFM4_HIBSY|nr:hypothetical protein F3Y22_tig00111842pilonHSYRG00050 [Hibiscus syriacus]
MDAYHEQQMGPLLDNMLLKFHILGEGIIGQAALTGKHQLIFSDSTGNENISDNCSNLCRKRGVVQFGSTQKIFESLEILAEMEKLFYDMGNGCSTEPTGWSCSVQNLNNSSCFVHEIQDQNMNFDMSSGINCLAANTPCTSRWNSELLTMDDLSQWFSPLPQQHIHGAGSTMTSDPSCSVGWHWNGFWISKSWEPSEDIIMPLLHDDNKAVTSVISSSTSELHVHSMTGKQKGLLSELGLEKLLGCKPTRKRAKPGESTQPRLKDRQLIQDRIKELRGIIPHSGKQLSIDHLLERTIKYMLFLQGVTKYADKIKQADEPKLIGLENGKHHNTVSGGATWAFEVGTQSIPIVMLCEDKGFFLEIAEVIRGFPLNILKGVMELQEDKIWARFIVEAEKQVKRTNIIWSLLPLLQQQESNVIDSATQPSGNIDGGVSLLNSYQQPLLSPTVGIAERLQ